MTSNRQVLKTSVEPGSEPLCVSIHLPGQTEPVLYGRCERRQTATGVLGAFTDGQSYLERSNGLLIDPVTLPLGTMRHKSTALSGCFSVLLVVNHGSPQGQAAGTLARIPAYMLLRTG